MSEIMYFKGNIPVIVLNDFGNGELRCREISGNAFFCMADELTHDVKYNKLEVNVIL